MYETNLNRDVVKSEMDYRIGRIRDEIAGRRRRRTLVRRETPETSAGPRSADAGGTQRPHSVPPAPSQRGGAAWSPCPKPASWSSTTSR